MHTHFSAVAAIHAFLGVILVGTVWRLVSLHLAASTNSKLSALGQGMNFQY